MTAFRPIRDAIASVDREVAVVLLSIPLVMTTLWYFGRPDFYHARIAPHVPPDAPFGYLYPFMYFSLSCVVLRSVVPLLLVRFVLRRRPRDYGWHPRGTFEYWWGYLGLFVLVIPFVVYASTLPSFLDRYPFCSEAIRDNRVQIADFVVSQLFYGLIFLSGESYWRGFVAFGLERRFGYAGILVMVIPYCMSHYGKPVAETYGSILAGIVLGFLALRHRSFWLGVAVHWAVAMLMDVLAIARRGIEVVW
ncbi:MAG: CPBP family intramembrane metalloprotease [Deltaproteobacteria bacterium]|nr:CPBP family intramembrane metalloprotease [Deltaproteobacteria bacterium]